MSLRSASAIICAAVFTIVLASSSPRSHAAAAPVSRTASPSTPVKDLMSRDLSGVPGKEVRVVRMGSRLAAQRRLAWERSYRPVAAARVESALWHSLGWYARPTQSRYSMTASRPEASPYQASSMWTRWPRHP